MQVDHRSGLIMLICWVPATCLHRLSEYLARVRAGSEVLVTERGRPVAKIVPVDTAGDLAELEREGIVRPGSIDLPPEILDVEPPRMAGPGLTQALLDERSEGR